MDKNLKPIGHNHCNLCGFQPTLILLKAHKKVHSPQHKVVYRGCPKCLSISLDIDYSLISSFYKKHAIDDQNKLDSYHFQEISETWETLRFLVSSEPSILEGKNKFFFDIGCGAAGSLSVFKSFGYRVGGCEPRASEAKYARENKGFNVINKDYKKEVLPPDLADFILCYHVLEHTDKPFKIISTIHYHLKPDGLLYIEVPNALDSDIYRLGFDHISMFIPFNLEQSLNEAGFKVITIINRHDSPTHGFGILAQRNMNACNAIEKYDSSYLTLKKKYLKLGELALRLNYGFFVERPRGCHTLEILYRSLFLFPSSTIKQILRSSRRKKVLSKQ